MNTIKVTCENPDELIAGFGAGARTKIQFGATEATATTDLTTIPLVAGTRIYTYEHLAGTSSTWYRFRFEDSTGVNANAFSAAFQTGDETAGLLCSLYDVKQELSDPSSNGTNDELILEKIRQVSAAIELYVGQWLAPRPTDPASDMTLLFDVPWNHGATRSLLLDQGRRLTGIRRLTSIGLATQSQPETGGVYTAGTVADFLLRPRPSADGPALRLEVTPYPSGSSVFYPGYNTVSVVGGFGPASVPADIQGVAIRASVRRFIGKGAGALSIPVGPEGTMMLLPDMSGADRMTLDAYRIQMVA